MSDPIDSEPKDLPPADEPAPAGSAEQDDVTPDAPVEQIHPAPAAFPGMQEVRMPTAAEPDDGPVVTPFSGREATLVPGSGDEAAAGLTGREQTLVGGTEGTASTTPLAPLSGREQTLVGGSEASASTPVAPLSGREQTLVGGGEAAPATPLAPLSGREQTMLGGDAAAPPPPPTPLSGREQPMLGDTGATMPVDDATGATIPVDAGSTMPVDSDTGTAPTMPTFTVEQPAAAAEGRPRTRATSSAGFDAGWHLQGRKGPFTGQTWGDFELGGVLGEGGMGAVYRGVQLSLKRRVAIKVLPPNLAQDKGLLQRFQLEATTASRLTSPHIVQVYFIGEYDGNHYYAMEHVEGTDLYDIMKERREADDPLKPEECVDFMLQAARGLIEADRIGVVHRDIKPPNMMVDRHGLLKLADFGIVKVLGESQLTMTGQAVGTPAYVSPEQGRGDSEIDQRSDLYSLGVVFYELVCGRKPFEATTPNSLIYKHCFEEPELPKAVNPDITDEVQAVVLKLLQKKPENRYQSAQELATDLEAIKTGNMLASALANLKGTGADEAKREQLSWVQRHLLPLALAAGLLVAAGGFGGYWYLTRQTAAERQILEVKNELLPTLQKLDEQAPIPAGIAETLARYAELVGEDDGKVVQWRSKLTRVQGLRQRLAALDGEEVGAEERQSAAADLDRYEAEVGIQDVDAVRWRERLARLDQQEQDLRQRLLDLSSSAFTQASRDAAAQAVGELARLVPAEDQLVQQTRRAIETFDQAVAGKLAELAVLDQGDLVVTEDLRARLKASLEQLVPMIGAGDERLQRWAERLDRAGGEVTRLRSSLAAVFTRRSRPTLADLDAVSGELDLLAELVGEADGDLKRWRAQAASSRARVDELRSSITALAERSGDDQVLPLPLIDPATTWVTELAELAGAGDEVVMTWRQTIARSSAVLQRLDDGLRVLDKPAPIGLAEQTELASALDRLVAKAGIPEARAARYRERLAAEARRVEQLRERLAVLDTPVPFTEALQQDLARFLADVTDQDPDAQRWRATAQRIRDLWERLAVLDRQAPVPEGVGRLFDKLIAEVGSEAPEVLRWQEKVALIESALAALAPLDRVAPVPPEAREQLALLAQQVGETDAAFVRYRAKLDRIDELQTQLEVLPDTLVLDPVGVERQLAAFKELRDLVGRSDATVQRLAPRLAELLGPEQPPWADRMQRDAAGLVATATIAGVVVRWRFCPSGSVRLGSPDDEAGREADEVPVRVHLSRAMWIMETECTQALWQALMGTRPSRFPDPRAPVERVSRPEAEGCATAVAEALGVAARLPTEAEWEYACRAGEPAAFAGEPDKLAWFAANSGERSHPVAERYPNALGLYDMHGNVAEWVADGYQPYPTTTVTDHQARSGDRGVARGGSWGDDVTGIRAANRIAVRPELRSCYLGFRLVLPVQWSDDAGPDGEALVRGAADDRRQFRWHFGGAEVSISLPLPAVQAAEPDTSGTEAPTAPATESDDRDGAVPEPPAADDSRVEDPVSDTASSPTDPTEEPL